MAELNFKLAEATNSKVGLIQRFSAEFDRLKGENLGLVMELARRGIKVTFNDNKPPVLTPTKKGNLIKLRDNKPMPPSPAAPAQPAVAGESKEVKMADLAADAEIPTTAVARMSPKSGGSRKRKQGQGVPSSPAGVKKLDFAAEAVAVPAGAGAGAAAAAPFASPARAAGAVGFKREPTAPPNTEARKKMMFSPKQQPPPASKCIVM